MFDNTDEYDFVPSGSSKLASLFDNTMINDASNSLIYTAPKQPKPKKDVDLKECTKNKSETSVILAKVVSLWKLEDKQYRSMGRHGLAVIGSTNLNLFEIISYKEKNNIIFRRKINDTFKWYTQKDGFSTFYDNENQNWLVKFENFADQDAFCNEIKTHGANIISNNEPSQTSNSTESAPKPQENVVTKPEVLPKISQTVDKNAESGNSDSSGSNQRAKILSRITKMGQQILPSNTLTNASSDISDSELDDTSNDHRLPPRRIKRAVPSEKQKEKLPRVDHNYLQKQVIPTQGVLKPPVQYPQQNMVSTFSQGLVEPFQQNTLVNQTVPYDTFHQYIMLQNTELKMNLVHISEKLDNVLTVGNKYDVKTDESNLKSKIKSLELRTENLVTELGMYEKLYADLQAKYKKSEEKNNRADASESVIKNLNKQIENFEESLKMMQERTSNYEKLENDLKKCREDIERYEKTIQEQKMELEDLKKSDELNKDKEDLQKTIDILNGTVQNLTLQLEESENAAEEKKSNNEKLELDLKRCKKFLVEYENVVETQKSDFKMFQEYYGDRHDLLATSNSLYDTVRELKEKLEVYEKQALRTEEEKQKRLQEREKIITLFSDKTKSHMNSMYQSIMSDFEEDKSYCGASIRALVARNVKETTFALLKDFVDTYKPEGQSIDN